MNRTRLLFLVALLAVAAFAIVPAMAEDKQDNAVGPVGRWGVRVGGQGSGTVLIDTVTGQAWLMVQDPRRRPQYSWLAIKPPE